MLKKLKFWLDNSRWVALPQSLMPAVTAVAMAAARPGFLPLCSFLAVLGVCAAHLSFNLFDDYFDYKKNKPGVRETLARAGFRARIGKCGYLVSGEATVGQLLLAALVFGGIAALCGVVIFIFRGASVIWFAFITALLGISYSGGPLRLGYRGVGELILGLIFGPMLVSGVYFSACGGLHPGVVIVGAAIGSLVANILYTHSALDLEADRSVGKLTLAGIIPTNKGRLIITMILTFAPFGVILAGILSGLLSPSYLLLALTIPLAIALAKSMREFHRGDTMPLLRRTWYGPMTRWKEIREAGIDWFMLRWYIARNLLAAFSCIVIAATVLEWAL